MKADLEGLISDKYVLGQRVAQLPSLEESRVCLRVLPICTTISLYATL